MSISPHHLLPRQIRLEASTVCQLKCPSCPTASGEAGQKLGVGFLTFQDFKKFLDGHPDISHIELSNWGEVFLNKDLLQILRYAYQENVALHVANGANLNTVRDEVLEGVVKYKLRHITCSIDGASQETYSIYRVKGHFEQVIQNIRTINAWKARYRSPFPRLKWQFIPFGHNEDDIAAARELARSLDMDFFVKLSWADLYKPAFSPVRKADLIRKESALGVADRDEYRQKYGTDYVERSCCFSLWTVPQVNYDGKVLGCPINYWGDFGNAYEDGLNAVVNNDKMTHARAMLMGTREAKAGIPCSTCKVYSRMKAAKSWITEEEIPQPYHSSRRYIMCENKLLGVEKTRQLAALLNRFESRVKSRVGPLTSTVHPLSVPLQPDREKAWKVHPIFRGRTKGMTELACHASVLVQGHSPHPPHAHREEEILMVLSGQADLVLPALKDQIGTDRVHVRAGQFVYYPAGFAHTLEAMGDSPVNYLLLKWHAKSRASEGQAMTFRASTTCDALPDRDARNATRGWSNRVLFEGPTEYLKKLQSHVSTLSPGAGYDAHRDAHDVAIVVLEGEVETLGRRAGPHSVVFYAAGQPHAMSNPGTVETKYLVFEFHR
jgi:MoaA/NifB/PqqE/SkfB family radical SAM enzyme/mannose-6-phosphate isomerase-like protein (cupin superfamily)